MLAKFVSRIGAFPSPKDPGSNGKHMDRTKFTTSSQKPHGHWAGNIVFNDNHVDLLTTMTPEGLVYETEDEIESDNIFAVETGPDGGDAILSFTKAMMPDGPVLQFD